MNTDDDLPPNEGDAGAIDAPVTEAIEEATTDTIVAEEPPAPPSLEDLAGEMGWRPQTEWKGDPEKWKPAHEFVRSTVDVNHKLGNRLKGMEDTIGNMARTSAQLTERAVAQERQRLQTERDEAFDTGDREGFQRADQALSQLPQVAPPPAPEVGSFIERNADWYGKNEEATTFAFNRCEELAKMGLSPARQLAKVEREMKDYFPDLFPAEKPAPKPAPLNTPGNRGSAPAKKGFTAMPADAQAAALDYEKRKICSRDEYAKLYFEEA